MGRRGGTELAPRSKEQRDGAGGGLGPVGHRGVVLLVEKGLILTAVDQQHPGLGDIEGLGVVTG